MTCTNMIGVLTHTIQLQITNGEITTANTNKYYSINQVTTPEGFCKKVSND